MTRQTPPAAAEGYCRDRTGTVVHRQDCRRKGQAPSWRFVDGKTHAEVLALIAETPWLRACTFCMTARHITGQQLELGRALRDDGMATADAGQPEDWRAAVDRRIAELADTGRPFTADDVSTEVGDSPTGSRGAMGARFHHASRRGVIRRVGYVPSGRPSVRAHPVGQWQGVA